MSGFGCDIIIGSQIEITYLGNYFPINRYLEGRLLPLSINTIIIWFVSFFPGISDTVSQKFLPWGCCKTAVGLPCPDEARNATVIVTQRSTLQCLYQQPLVLHRGSRIIVFEGAKKFYIRKAHSIIFEGANKFPKKL